MNTRDSLLGASDEEIVRRLADCGDTELVGLAYEAGRRRLGKAVPNLILLLDSSDIDVQLGSLEALGEIGDDRAGPRILLLMDNHGLDRSIRDTSTWTLGLLKYRPATHKLASMLLDPEPTVRSCAVAALVAIGDKTVFPAVCFQLATETDPGVQRDLAIAAENLRPVDQAGADAMRSQRSRQIPAELANDARDFPPDTSQPTPTVFVHG